MQVTGYQIREALRRWNLRRDAESALFEDSLRRFPDDEKPAPKTVIENFTAADRAIALLQVAQDRYNLAVTIEVKWGDGRGVNGIDTMTLAEAVKLVGGAGRVEKMWRSAANPQKDRYASREEVRNPDEVRAKPVMKTGDILVEADKSARYAGALRQAIALANGREIDLSDEGLSKALAG